MLVLGSGSVWGQTDYSGVYYIGTVTHSTESTTNNFYLCPTEGYSYYQSTSPYYTNEDNHMPFLTTYKCRSTAGYDERKALWVIEKHPSLDCYYIKHAIDGKYLTYNAGFLANKGRVRFHLEESPSNNDYALFFINYYDNTSSYEIISKYASDNNIDPDGGKPRKYLNINKGNQQSLAGTNADGTQAILTGGIIGLWTAGNSESSGSGKFYLESAVSIDPPTITNNFDGTITIAAATGATIYYTTDGSTPTTESYAGTGTTSVNVNQTESMTVIKAIAKAESDYYPTVATTYNLPSCERPSISVSGGNVTITCTTEGATIHYTTDGSHATSSSTVYNGPFAKGSANEIRAIATKVGYVNSNEAALLPPTEVSFSSEITDMNGNYSLASNFSSDVSIGTSENPFSGTIDGNYQTFSLSQAFIDVADGAIIKNIIISSANISGSGNAGAIVNTAKGSTRIYNCGVLDGSISGDDNVGGIAGELQGLSRVINCYNYANIESGDNCGGIVGYNRVASTSSNLQTMVMNCMFYGNITGGNAAPIYGGEIIHNKYSNANNTGLNNYCYFLYDEEKVPYVKTIANDKYHGALGAEERYLNRFEFFRMTLNSTRDMAAFYVTGDATQKDEMAKWVLDKSIAPYPILKTQGKYPSVVNPDAAHATAQPERNKGGLLGTLSVTISGVGSGAVFSAPSGASITNGSLQLNVTDKDYDNFNYNYRKVQLPYYNEVGKGNYTKASDGTGRVVTGWKITSITGGTPGSFTTDTYDYPSFNFVDRKCTNKDLYGTGGSNRVFAQGAYWEVPDGVESITIEPYWAKAVYLSDANYDVTYSGGTKYGVTIGGSCPSTYNGQQVYNSVSSAMTNLGSNASHSVYDYAVVLVGNYHQYSNDALVNDDKPVTFMSADLDGDDEPDNTLFYYHNQRKRVAPIRFDFLNIPGVGMVKRTHDATMDPEPGIFKPRGWFEITNTVFIRFGQFEYAGGTSGLEKTILAPLILQGGIYEQFVSCCRADAHNTNYLLIGSNAWFKNFANGCHTAQANKTPKVPINVAGGDYTNFYLTGIYQPNANEDAANAECYIDGGRFTEVAGAGMQQIKGDVTWLINAADITSFFGGGINAAKPITGSISTTISNSYVNEFYGGPKFGDMSNEKTVTTNATDCHFGKFFGAGYGGTAFNRVGREDDSKADNSRGWDSWVTKYYKRAYDGDNGGISTNYDYEFILHSDGNQTVGRFFVNYASLSLASTKNVTNTLSGCTIGTFYGGGSLGAVNGDVNSTLTNCTVTGSAFGAGFSASVPTVEVWNTGAFLTPRPTYNRTANVFNNANVKTPKDNNQFVVYTWSNTYGTNADPFTDTEDGKHYIHTDQSLDNLGTVSGNVTLNILGSNTHIYGDVYGGGAQSKSNTNYYKAADPVLTTKTTINLLAGTIDGDVYGGGQGRLAKDAVGTPGSAGYEPAIEAVAADAGSTKVNLNGMEAADYNGATFADLDLEHAADTDPYTVKDSNKGCIVKGSIFGCNNLNGTPKGDATVNIYKTEGYEGYIRTGANAENATAREAALDDIDDSHHSYEVKAVYGGGNLAAYEPNDVNNKHTQVNIYGCGSTSIQQVYGGGNAASTPATQVDIWGTYEIEEVFGGGNGKDDISHDGGTTKIPNPGANVGFKDYWDYKKEKDLEAYDTKAKRQASEFITNYVYGTGEAHVNIHGGRIHRVYGGSNTKGNVKTVAVTMLEETGGCDFKVDEAYGGGKSAQMDGASRLEMACIPGLKNAYGGAEAANIENDVTLTITNGNFDRVFGGNNVSGTINGTITVNIEETGCHLITIGQLYGGGNQAAYTGPEILDNNNEPTGKRQGPTLNVRSFTSIGEVYGGGYGKTATVTGDTYVNINVCDGKNFGDSQNTEVERANNYTGNQTISFSEFRRTDDGGFETDNAGNRIVDHQKVPVYLPPFTSGEIGAINNVYGGGNAAKVIGDTFVNIGKKDGNLVFATPTNATVENRTHQIKGATITGNVYGGGNNAEVTGNTNVTIGKKTTN